MADLPNDENNNQPIDDGIDEVLESIISFNEDSIEAVKDLNEAVNFFADLSEKIGTTPDVEDASTKRNQEEAKIDYGLTIDQVTEATVEALRQEDQKRNEQLGEDFKYAENYLDNLNEIYLYDAQEAQDKGNETLEQILEEVRDIDLSQIIDDNNKKETESEDKKKTKEETFADKLDAVISELSSISKNITSSLSSSFLNPQGAKSPLGLVAGATNILAGITPALGGMVGKLAGSLVGALAGPVGAGIGATVGKYLGGMGGDAVAAILKTAVGILESIDSHISGLENELFGISPEVTEAVINQEMRLLEDSFRRADQIGPQLADLINSQTEFQLSSRKAYDAMFLGASPVLETIYDAMAGFPETIGNAVGTALQGIGNIPGLGGLKDIGNQVIDNLKNINKNTTPGSNDPFSAEGMMDVLNPVKFRANQANKKKP